jgi:phenylalanyl-tRNA synthetase beta chain
MNISIRHSHLLDHLSTKATAPQIARSLTLCGPTVDRLTKVKNDYIYEIEITTNRVDSASVRGIAKEASAILPQCGFKATLKPLRLPTLPKSLSPKTFKVTLKTKDTKRTMGIVLQIPKVTQTPSWMKERLASAGIRSLSLLVDITNYTMIDTGHPTHIFDFDAIKKGGFILRNSKKGETAVSLENKKYTLPGGDLVIARKNGEIIDLPGIIGTKNSIVSSNTKNALFFLENNNPKIIRNTSMKLGVRTMAAILNEKGVDPYLGKTALLKGLSLYQKLCGAKAIGSIDIFPQKPKAKAVTVGYDLISKKIGVKIPKKDISNILGRLEFTTYWKGNTLSVTPPTQRIEDISIPEDIIEEIARIYGYHNIPNIPISSPPPKNETPDTFSFETKVKNTLLALKATEIYTSSLVSKALSPKNSLALKNPLGEDFKYLRQSLSPSLLENTHQNKQKSFHIYEMANVYAPRKNALPKEKMILSGVFSGYSFKKAKGVLETLLEVLNTNYSLIPKDHPDNLLGHSLEIKGDTKLIGYFGQSQNHPNLIIYEIDMQLLKKSSKETRQYTPPSTYPPQIEDLTFKVPPKTFVSDIKKAILTSDKQITKVALKSTFKDKKTFTIYFQNPKKTLSNKKVKVLRQKVIEKVSKKTGATIC